MSKNSRFERYEFNVKDGDTWKVRPFRFDSVEAEIVLKFTNNDSGGEIRLYEVSREMLVKLLAQVSKTLVAIDRAAKERREELDRHEAEGRAAWVEGNRVVWSEATDETPSTAPPISKSSQSVVADSEAESTDSYSGA